jgi:hypothetical protein
MAISHGFNGEPAKAAANVLTEAAATDPRRLGQVYGDDADFQIPADVAIVMPTVLRPVIVRAIESIFEQDFQGRIQILIGVDQQLGSLETLLQVLSRRPRHISAVYLNLPWSTSASHGGVHTALDCGSLRAILSFMANSRAVTYLDDDNTMMPKHVRLLFAALAGNAYSFSQRLLVDERTNADLVVDRWDSVGPNRGRMAKQGGFVDTNCLMLDKIICCRVLGRWAESGTGKPGLTADRNLFSAIHQAPHGRVDQPTLRYYIRETSIFHHFIKTNAVF